MPASGGGRGKIRMAAPARRYHQSASFGVPPGRSPISIMRCLKRAREPWWRGRAEAGDVVDLLALALSLLPSGGANGWEDFVKSARGPRGA